MIKVCSVFTGSYETEEMLRLFLSVAGSVDGSVPRSTFDNTDGHFRTMTKGRNGKNDRYPQSTAMDDTGGFFDEKGGDIYLTEKAKSCIKFKT